VVANAASVAPKLMASILVVDDDVTLCESLVLSLRARGYDASAVSSVADALRCLGERHYDVLLTDLHMQGGDGMDLILALRETSPGTRPVLMSADATARESQRALDLGAVRVLCKPFEDDELLQVVERAAEYSGGFWASVHGLSLVDTLQMFHFSRRTLSVHFLGGVRAALHMSEGQLVHAEHDDLRGEAALATILRMPAGSLQTFALEPVTQTIFRDFQGVLLDQLRQLDERERDSKSPEHPDLFDDDFADIYDATPADAANPKVPPVASPVRGSASSGERPAFRAPGEKRKTVEKIDIACERIVTGVDGAVACAVIDLTSGTLLGSHNRQGSSDARNDVVVAATVDLFRGPSTSRIEALRHVQPGGAASEHAFEEVQLTSKHGLHFAKTLKSGNAVILLVTDRSSSSSLGMGWAQLRSAIPVFERLMAAEALGQGRALPSK
jgi:DNA-binding response OmpR family regulator